MILALALALLIGVSLGLLGGGGSILTVPILVYALGVAPKPAIATSLLVVGVTSAVAALSRARAGDVQWRTGLVFGGAGMAGAFVGGQLAGLVPGGVLLLGFAAMMLVTAVAMMRGRRAPRDEPRVVAARPVGRIVAQGALVGLVAGLVGAGGGFLVVPALVLLGGLPMKTAVGTSLVVIAMQSAAGLAGHLGHTSIDWRLAGLVSAAAVAGSLIGARLSRRISQAALRKGFAWFVLAMGLFIVGRQLPAAARAWPALASLLDRPAVLAVAGAAVVLVGLLWHFARNRFRTPRQA